MTHKWLKMLCNGYPLDGGGFMKHAGSDALRGLADLLDQIRAKDGIQEKKLGIFYRQSNAFLHFHEDPAGLFADVKLGAEFNRYPVNTKRERTALLSRIDRTLKK
jgi:hypothetical protein